jgi:hypothetical protein
MPLYAVWDKTCSGWVTYEDLDMMQSSVEWPEQFVLASHNKEYLQFFMENLTLLFPADSYEIKELN